MKLHVLNNVEYEIRRAASNRKIRQSLRRRALRWWFLLALIRASVVIVVAAAIDVPEWWPVFMGLWMLLTVGSLMRAMDTGLP